ncbi:xanthine/CO dehydrogenase XdhC/CoxF family maturation factor [Arcticibacter pallidicorallinus]|uniref:Xanthine/CO dehydrogenase XdhC/CoxF family maturation factor n=1 Tax=Arcticibacter pallidicorallinus TaxID=1259464 RepID=A0A2T0U102_9SPHI|nr:XdhC/CoxI family protein [Arcticibacter pallidicorallinus]PRY51584.1 xanthine/CO dehydrogenase XdhC/CoxF family maturation factor [Arcticibacter pallidicorallinus]
MKEINDIIKAYETASAQRTKTALATVVHMEGSSYRRPGARMLVTETGELTGAISGGCLEGDALRKALLAIHESRNKLVTYDTNNEDDARFGVQLGCNGVIHILFEPINPQAKHNPITLLKKAITERRHSVIVTLFSLLNKQNQPGTSCLLNDNELIINNSTQYKNLPPGLSDDAQTALTTKLSLVKDYSPDLIGFVEVIEPQIALVIVGAGNDVIPLTQMSQILGWSTTLIDGRHTHANRTRFPNVSKIFVLKPESVLDEVVTDSRTAFVLMTHNYNYDLEVLKQLATVNCAYIGILGPKKKFLRMIDDLADNGLELPETVRDNIYSPVGLDLGAETPEEIALSVVAEIKAAFACRKPIFLRDKEQAIHAGSKKLPA